MLAEILGAMGWNSVISCTIKVFAVVMNLGQFWLKHLLLLPTAVEIPNDSIQRCRVHLRTEYSDKGKQLRVAAVSVSANLSKPSSHPDPEMKCRIVFVALMNGTRGCKLQMSALGQSVVYRNNYILKYICWYCFIILQNCHI